MLLKRDEINIERITFACPYAWSWWQIFSNSPCKFKTLKPIWRFTCHFLLERKTWLKILLNVLYKDMVGLLSWDFCPLFSFLYYSFIYYRGAYFISVSFLSFLLLSPLVFIIHFLDCAYIYQASLMFVQYIQ